MVAKPNHRLLLVEDSVSFAFWLKTSLEKEGRIEIVLARSLAEAREAIAVFEGDFFLALLDLNLPDASSDDVMQLAHAHRIPSIVFTGSYSDELRSRLFELGVIDYVNKDNPYSLNYLISLVRRQLANQQWRALVVDDSATSRMQIARLLEKYRFTVVEASDGPTALEILRDTPDVRIAIVDYCMPGMNGHELTKAIRQKFSPDRLIVIGVSGHDPAPLSARFLKLGATDFLNKPFAPEEFFCRVTQNMNHLDQLEELRERATHDHLTGLRSRRYFVDTAEALAAQARAGGGACAIGIFDIDELARINLEHGQDVGDRAIKHVARLIRDAFQGPTEIVARFEGDGFGVCLCAVDEEAARQAFERVRAEIEANPLQVGGRMIGLSASIGVCVSFQTPIGDMIHAAEAAASAAKVAGGDHLYAAGAGRPATAATG